MTTTTAKTAGQLNRQITHPEWCVRDCCVDSTMGDVWHEGEWVNMPLEGIQDFTASRRRIQYGMVGGDDHDEGIELTIANPGMCQSVTFTVSPETAQGLARFIEQMDY